MKVASEVSPEKLRGGFYSPSSLVAICLGRITALLGDARALSILEPSAGDGAFIRGLTSHVLNGQVATLTAVEIIESEANKCRTAGAVARFDLKVHQGSFLSDVVAPTAAYDAAVGNPPYVRYQFIDSKERRHADELAAGLGTTLKGVSNLWIPIFLKALACLRDGGAFAFIIPAECMTGISASAVRKFLVQNTQQLRVDLFPPSSFPDVLQEVVILSGVRRIGGVAGSSSITISEDHGPTRRLWQHTVDGSEHTWTKLLLTPGQVAAFEEASSLPGAVQLGQVAKFSVATVTGANDFFSVSQSTIERYGLAEWVRPLLPRIRSAPGMLFTAGDYEAAVASGAKAGLLDFSAGSADPLLFPGSSSYISSGEEALLHQRYKCRIRSPWYRVPVVPPGDILLSKRSHLYPRVVLNTINAITTDTIYQGRLTPAYEGQGRALVSSFHNSLTILSAEIEGRSFGGGVLELVPSEVSRLRVFVAPALADDLEKLDAVARSTDPDKDESLVEETDRRLSKVVNGLTDSLLASIAEARYTLQRRRLDRNRSNNALDLTDETAQSPQA